MLPVVLWWQREQMQGCGIDLASAIEAADVGIELGQRQAPFDDRLGNAEVGGDVGFAEAFAAQPCEGVLVHLVHRQALDILSERGLDGRRVVVARQHHAG